MPPVKTVQADLEPMLLDNAASVGPAPFTTADSTSSGDVCAVAAGNRQTGAADRIVPGLSMSSWTSWAAATFTSYVARCNIQ